MLEEPNDPFYAYALALEFMHTNRLESLNLLESLIQKHPDYLPTYYQAGLICIEIGKIDVGRTILEKGIALAQSKREIKTMNELRTLLDNL